MNINFIKVLDAKVLMIAENKDSLLIIGSTSRWCIFLVGEERIITPFNENVPVYFNSICNMINSI
jgi:hypothetical protein